MDDLSLHGLFTRDWSARPGAPGGAPLDPVLPRHIFVGHARAWSLGSLGSGEGSVASEGGGLTGSSEGRSRRPLHDGELPEVGAIIDKYRIEEVIGQGGFAVVYRATHLLLHMPVAMKLLRPKVTRRRPTLPMALCEEARFAAQINHPNVVRVFDVTHTPKITYIVMEYIEGVTLAKSIKHNGALDLGTVLRVGLDVTAGLQAGREKGLIHRDIKPANILLARTGQTKIVDLGLALSNSSGLPMVEGGALGRLSMVGTPGYMAPEQAANPETVDFRADIYSLGVSLYHAAVGVPPFPLEDRARCIELHRTEPVPSPERFSPGFPQAVSRLLLWMLAKNPADRPGSYDTLTQELRTALDALPLRS
jgi:serine/threonine-protein kinase